MTIVKGTFPVRFRRDGKDGVNTWLKYAKELDVFDESTEKYYPSKMYDTFIEDCIYIGLGKGVGDEPTDPRYYTWNKWKGDDGTSFTAKGQAVAHHTSLSAYNSTTKSTGLHLVDNTGGALLKYWSGSATTDKTCEDGDAYTTSDKHLWIKDGATWNDLGEIQGPKGDNAYLHYITVDSYSYSSSGSKTAVIRKQIESGVSNTIGGTASRGLTIWEISKTGTAISRYSTYDTYGDTTAADKMAQTIEGGIVQDKYFLAITSYDGCGFSANLIAALKKYGGGDIADYTPKHQAFSFLGYKGMPEGTAQQVLNIGEGKQASIYALVNNGICQGKGQDGRSIKSIVNEYQRHDKGDDNNKPTGIWSESSPELNYTYPYLWRRQTITYTDGTNYVDIKCIGKIGDKGIDGNGSDFAFCRTTTSTVPTKPSGKTPISQQTNTGSGVWTDDPVGVSKDFPYEWVSEMKMVNGEWKGYGTPSLWAKYSEDGATGHGWVASVDRNNKFTEAQWGTYGTMGHTERWTDTSSVRNGCRVGDIFLVWGNATDTGNGHNAFYRCTNSSGDLEGTCISHTISPKGDKGDDAYSYKLESSIKAINLDNEGYPLVSSFKLTAYMFKGKTSLSFDGSYTIVVYISYAASTYPITKSVNLSSTTSSAQIAFTDGSGNKLKDIKSISCYLYHGGVILDSFDILPVKAGAAGVSYFPNMCGVWDGANVTYKWTNGSRDMVTFYVGGTPYLFAVKTAGTTIKADVHNLTPDKDSRWEKADSPFSMLFANFVYTDNASVGGFVFSANQMRSVSTTDGKSPSDDGSNCNILIDGNSGLFKANRVELTGTINAKGGSIGKFTIRDKGLGLTCTADNADITMTCESKNKRKARIFVTTADNAVISAQTDTSTAAEFTATDSSGTALRVSGNTILNGIVNITGTVNIEGLRISTYKMSVSGTIPSNVELVTFTNSSAITVGLPSASGCKGKVLFLKRIGTGGVTLSGSSANLIIGAGGTGTSTTSSHVGSARSMMYISNGTSWIEFYCG